MKTIDINAKEWFDRINGNSYFSAKVTIDFGYKSEKTIYLPFQYGYGDHYIDVTKNKLVKLRIMRLKETEKHYGINAGLSWICRERKIKLRYNIQKNCLQRDVKSYGIE